MASELLSGLWFYWLITGQGAEGAEWARRYMASSRLRTPAVDRYMGDDAAAEILRFTGDVEPARQLKEGMVATGFAHPTTEVIEVPIAGDGWHPQRPRLDGRHRRTNQRGPRPR